MQNRPLRLRQEGFSLIELIISVVLLLIIVTFVFGGFTNALRVARRERGLADRDAQVRRAIELMTVELSQAGVTPEFTLNPADPLSNGTQINAAITSSPTNQIVFNGSGAGLYPGRSIVLTLPQSASNSESLVIQHVNSGCSPSPCVVTTQNTAHTHATNDYISSPMLPIPFGILNPPPLTSGTPPVLPLTSTQKPPSGTLTRIGFVGDIFGDGTLRYVEYSWDQNSSILYRSETPISQSTKNSPVVLLEFVTAVNFTIIYPDTSTPIPTAVQISLTVLSSSPDLSVDATTKKNLLIPINSTTLVVPRGTAAAAQIFKINGDSGLRAMAPPCQTTASPPVNRYPPCDSWATTATPLWDWWSNVYHFTQTAAFSGQTPAALQ